MIKAVLFDFNGVLLLDSQWHEEAWNELSILLRNKLLSKMESEKHVHGRTPEDTLNFLLGHKASSTERKKYLDKKENLYQKISLTKPEFKLTKGAVNFFKKLDKLGIKKTIATSSPKVLIEFYYNNLNLKKYFPIDSIIFNDGTFLGKPAPDIFIKAANKLNTNPKDCMVIEDAVSGIEAARKAKAGKIVLYLNGKNSNISQKAEVNQVVSSFEQIILE